jgi:hypothetical protein
MVMEYSIKEISEFAKDASSDIETCKYECNVLGRRYRKSIEIIGQLLRRSPDKELCDAIGYIMSESQYEKGCTVFTDIKTYDIRFSRVAISILSELDESWTKEEIEGIIETCLYKLKEG